MKTQSLFSLLILLLLWTGSVAQHVGYKLYTVDDGLAQSEVTVIHQDNKGLLWVGTKSGVCRFDGRAFQTIADTNQVSLGNITFIGNMNDSTVFIVSRKGYLVYRYGDLHDSIYSGQIAFGPSGTWVKDGMGNIMSWENERFVHFRVDPKGRKTIDRSIVDRINPIVASQKGSWRSFFFAEISGNFYFSDKLGQLCCLRQGKVVRIDGFSGHNVFQGKDGMVYFLGSGGQTEDSKSKQWGAYPINIHAEKAGHLMLFKVTDTLARSVYDFGTGKSVLDRGFCIYDSSHFLNWTYKEFSYYQDSIKETCHVDVNISGSNYIDREGNLWLGSVMGLVRLLPRYFSNFNEREGLHGNSQFIAEDAYGAMVTGNYDEGVQILRNDRFVSLTTSGATTKNTHDEVYPGGGTDHKGIVHICMNPTSQYLWDGRTMKAAPGPNHGAGFIFYEDSKDYTDYLGCIGGLLIYPENGPVRLMNITPGGKSNKIVSIARDGNDRLMLGGFFGISMLEGEQVKHLPNQEFPFELGANAMVKDFRSNVWIGNNNGLYLFDNKRFVKVENPWFGTLVLSLCLADSNTLFVGGLRGIGLLDLKSFYARDTVIIRYFDGENGFEGNECQQNAVTLDRAGRIWFATNSSIVRLDPKMIKTDTESPLVYVSGISVIDRASKPRDVLSTYARKGRVVLSHKDVNLRIDYTGVCFRAPGHVKYRYFLEGQDKEWSTATSERFTIYTNLRPGMYMFKVIACDEMGIWSAVPAEIVIVIRHAFWQTWWFWLIAVLLTAAFFFISGYLVMNQRRKAYHEKIESEKKIAELQLLAIRNQIDPHFTFNAMNSIASVILKDDKTKAYSFFVKLSNLIRQVLTSSDKITRSLSEELYFVQNFLEIEKLRFGNSFEFVMNIVQPVDLNREVPKMVVHTYVENALKHGLYNQKDRAGLLAINISEADGVLRIEVEDNGIGREKAKEFNHRSTGKGLMIMSFYYNYLDRYNDQKITCRVTDLYDENNQPAGTRVIVMIPEGFRYNPKQDETK